MVRKDWLNLNGLWEYAITGKADAAPEKYEGKILVPYPLESSLSGVKKKLDNKSRLWYRRTFEVPGGWAGKRVLLHFGAVDWETTVLLNGKELGTHRGGYDAFSFDITDALKGAGPQELIVSVYDATGGAQCKGKQNIGAIDKPGGIMYTPTSGIWQTVWLEPVGQASIEGLTIVPDVDAGVLRLTVAAKGPEESQTVEAVASAEGKEVARAGGNAGKEIALPIKDARLWSPDDPFLYDLKVALRKGDRELDAVSSYFGMRKIAIGKDENGINRILLNGKFVFQIGPLDQGFWPDGLYTAPTDEALRYDIEMTRKLGFNVARKHVKIEPDRWYYWCDKLGLMVWQDMPSGDVAPPKPKPPRPATTKASTTKKAETAPDSATATAPVLSPADVKRYAEVAKQFEQELKAMIDQRRNHPAIIMWVVFNEGWGQHDTVRLTKWVKQYDPTRLANCASGWDDFPVGDVIDKHAYPGPACPQLVADRAAVLGEFGGLGLGIPGHTWTQKTWGYRGMSGQEALTRQYVKLLRKVYELKDSPGLNAAIYTQTTDVETECNGLLTYDRALVKPDLDQVSAANRGIFPPATEYKVLAATSQKEGINWRYTVTKPADDWFKVDFDASSWKEGPGGFGTKGTPGSVVRTEWKTADIWLRREFTLGEGKPGEPQVLMHHDEDAEVYVNGVLAVKAGGHVGDYDQFDISAEARAALKPGKNIMAVHCHQTTGGQYIDAGIVEEVPAPATRSATPPAPTPPR